MSIDYFDQYRTDSGRTERHSGWSLSREQYGKGNDRASRVGIKGSEDFGSGLKAIYQIEFGVPELGSFLVGRHDTPLKTPTSKLDLFDDTMVSYQGTLGFNDIRADNFITYISELRAQARYRLRARCGEYHR